MKKLNVTIILLVIVSYCNALDYYWVGGTGNWNNFPNHWATTSGGSVFHVQLPTPNDDVHFDANSFPTIGDTLYLNLTNVYCHNMDWTGVQNNPVISTPHTPIVYPVIKIYGSLNFAPGVSINTVMSNAPYFNFEGSNGNFTITSAGILLTDLIFQSSYCTYTLNDDLNLYPTYNGNSIYLNQMNNCTFNTNGKNINCRDFSCNGTDTLTLSIANSVIHCEVWNINSNSLTLDATNSKIYCTGFSQFNPGGNHTYNDVETNGISSSYQNTFNDVVLPNGGSIGSSSDTFNSVYSYGGLNLGCNHSTFGKVVALGNLSIGSGNTSRNTIDSLNCNCPGSTISIGGSITVDTMWINSLPIWPVTIQGGGTNDSIIMNSGTFCTDYIYVQNMVATGGATFNAGLHSVDLGGNSGWNFVSCGNSPFVSNVWPGDANYDLITDNFDLLNIGMAYGDTGYVRPGASLSYVAQPGSDWFYQFINGVNVKHADCDGNGIVNAMDTLAVSLNYGQTHPARLAQSYSTTGFGPDLSFQMPGTSLTPGIIATIPIMIGSITTYGFAFTINFDPSLIVPGSMSISYAGSVFASTSNYIHIEKDFYANGSYDLAFSRINQVDASGSGLIATLTFTVANNAGAPLNLSFSNILFINHNGLEIPVNAHTNSIATGIAPIDSYLPSSFYPNPMSSEAIISFLNADHQNYFLYLYELTGRRTAPVQSTLSNTFSIERKNMQSGIYFYELTNSNKTKVAKGKFIVR